MLHQLRAPDSADDLALSPVGDTSADDPSANFSGSESRRFSLSREIQQLPVRKMIPAMGLDMVGTLAEEADDVLLNIRNTCVNCPRHDLCSAKCRRAKPTEAMVDDCLLWHSKLFSGR